MSSHIAIANLLYSYAEKFDSGDLAGAAGLFRHARVKAMEGEVDHEGLLALWRSIVTIHPDGTPLTKHVITNPIIEVDEAAGRATCRSYYTVLQSFPERAIKVVAAGRYHDEFEHVDGAWRWRYRDYSLLDLIGDLSRHVPHV